MLDLSIIVPAYNAASTIGHALGSLRGMGQVRWHCIVVDDGSTDGGATADLVADIRRYDSRFTLISKPNGGLGSARNAGLDYLRDHPEHRGSHVLLLDADDRILPWNFDAMFRSMPTKATSLCGHFRITDGAYQRLRRHTIPGERVGLAELLELHFVVTHCLVHRWEDIATHRFGESRRKVEDYEMWFKMAQAGVQWTVFDAPIVDYRCGVASMSHDYAALLRDGQAVVAEAFGATRVMPGGGPAGVDVSAEALAIRHGRQALTWATRMAIAGGPAKCADALALLRSAPGTPVTDEAAVAGSIDAALVVGLGIAPEMTDPAQLTTHLRAIDAWCETLVSAGLFAPGLAARLLPMLDAATHDAVEHAKGLIKQIIRDRRSADGTLTIFGYGRNGQLLAAAARTAWNGPIRIRDSKLDAAKPEAQQSVPPDLELEAWDATVSPHTVPVVSMTDDAGALGRAPLSGIDRGRLYRWSTFGEQAESVFGEVRRVLDAEASAPVKALKVGILLGIDDAINQAALNQARLLTEHLSRAGSGMEAVAYMVPQTADHATVHQAMDLFGTSKHLDHAHVHGHPAEAVLVSAEFAATCDVLLSGGDSLCLIAALHAAMATQGRTKVVLTDLAAPGVSGVQLKAFGHFDGAAVSSPQLLDVLRRAAADAGRTQLPVIAAPAGVAVAATSRKPTPGQLRVLVLARSGTDVSALESLVDVAAALDAAGANVRVDVLAGRAELGVLAPLVAAAKLSRSRLRLEEFTTGEWLAANARGYDMLLADAATQAESVRTAMAQGVVPVVTGASAAASQGIERDQTGLVIDSLAAAATAIGRLAGDRKLLGTMAAGAHALASERWSTAKQLQAVEQLIRSVAAAAAVAPSPSLAGSLLLPIEPAGQQPAPLRDMATGPIPALLARDMPATAYLAGLIDGPASPLRDHPLRRANRAIAIPGSLRPPAEATLGEWNRKGHLPLVIHRLLNLAADQRFGYALNKMLPSSPSGPSGMSSRLLPRIGLLGAGGHTAKLLEGANVESIVAVIETSADSIGETLVFGDTPVISLSRAREMALDGVIISDDLHEAKILAEATAALPGVPILPLYSI
jgi:hypothetical protein